MKTKLRIVKIIDPIICLKCDCAYVADVIMESGKRRKMFYCSRLDCDNWLNARGPSKEVEIENVDRNPPSD